MKRSLVFTAYNRPDYMQQSIATWNDVRNINLWPATFFIEPSEVQNAVMDAVVMLNTELTFKLNEEKAGVLVNPWNALNYAFDVEEADFVVLAEDDVLVSQDVLEFFEWCSEEYSAAKDILCLNAYSRIGGGKANQIIRDSSFSPLIWGIWKDRWDSYIKDTWDKDYSSGNADGSEAGWDWNINRILEDTGMTIIKPLQSRSDHIGQFNGTHMTPDLFDSSRGIDFSQIRGRQRYNEI